MAFLVVLFIAAIVLAVRYGRRHPIAPLTDQQRADWYARQARINKARAKQAAQARNRATQARTFAQAPMGYKAQVSQQAINANRTAIVIANKRRG
jgi:hypothetical protein